jgi:glycosyltransferase involved in cell wall biosynthesis
MPISLTKTPAPVSVLLAAYNGAAFIKDAIESVKAQTLPVTELIVIDDGSTDETAAIARSMGVHVFSRGNRGLAATRNSCIRRSSQTWLAFIDQDDIWEPRKIEMQMALASRNPEVALVTCDYSRFDGSRILTESVLNKYRASYQVQTKRACEGGSIIEQLEVGFADVTYLLLPSQAMVRRDVLERTGMFDETLESADDFDCFMRVLARHRMGVVERVLSRRREHRGNASNRYTRATLSCLAATYKVLNNPDLYPAATVQLCREWLPSNLRHAGARLLWDGETRKARGLFLKSARLELSMRTVLALAASITPSIFSRNIMSARYFVSKTLGI